MLKLYQSEKDIAVYDNDKPYSYAQFNSIVDKMIGYIYKHNIQKVAMLVEQGFFNYCLEWAAYLSGITFCCYDIDAPLERIKYCNQIFNPDIVVSNNILQGIETVCFEEILENNTTKKIARNAINEIAYVLFTSGSTGLPKGVMIKRIALENVVSWAKENYVISNKTVYAQYSKNSFDLSVLDIFLGLSSGATLIPFIGFNKLLPGGMIRKYKINHWHSVPSAFVALQNRHDLTHKTLSSMETIVFCGETLYPQLVNSILEAKPDVTVWNTYGPTEATIFCSAVKMDSQTFRTASHNSISIGRPINKIRFKLDSDTDEGELLIIGETVASGYLNNTDSSPFFDIVIDGVNIPAYHSGDIVKYENEEYYFICRKDNQVKIAGNRFDLDEITKALHTLGFFNVVSILFGNLIYTFIQRIDNLFYSVDELKSKLENFLPHYGIPSRIIFLDTIPLNSNGKVDKNKLKEIALSKGDN